MSLDFPKRSDRKILERIIPPPSGGRNEHCNARSQRVSLPYIASLLEAHYPTPLRFGDSSAYASDFVSLVFSLPHYSAGFSMVTKSLPFLNTVTFPEDSEMTMATALVKLVIPAAAI